MCFSLGGLGYSKKILVVWPIFLWGGADREICWRERTFMYGYEVEKGQG
jgi:hypothetical protein